MIEEVASSNDSNEDDWNPDVVHDLTEPTLVVFVHAHVVVVV